MDSRRKSDLSSVRLKIPKVGAVHLGVLVSEGYCHNCHKFGGSIQQKFTVSEFWKPESKTKVSAWLVSSGGSEGKSGSSSPWHFWIHRLISALHLCLHMLSPVFLRAPYLPLFFLIRTLIIGFSTCSKPRIISSQGC